MKEGHLIISLELVALLNNAMSDKEVFQRFAGSRADYRGVSNTRANTLMKEHRFCTDPVRCNSAKNDGHSTAQERDVTKLPRKQITFLRQ